MTESLEDAAKLITKLLTPDEEPEEVEETVNAVPQEDETLITTQVTEGVDIDIQEDDEMQTEKSPSTPKKSPSSVQKKKRTKSTPKRAVCSILFFSSFFYLFST